MSIVIDRRAQKSSKNESNRRRFIERYKRTIKHTIQDKIKERSIKDVDKPIDVPIYNPTDEGKIDYDRETGDYEHVISGNKEFIKGDKLDKKKGRGKGSGGDTEGVDEFLFTLTKEEFYELFFEDLRLPNFIKESIIDNNKMKLKRSGYVKDGIPARLDIRKSMEQAIARKIATETEEYKPPFIDEIDLRYRFYKLHPEPSMKAVVFFVMDVSGSMEEHHKLLSKKFFIFLYLFLTKNYEKVEVRFIRYHHAAKEVDEDTFFNERETGGTNVSPALQLVNEIIDHDYNANDWNIYIAHASDGDFGYQEDLYSVASLIENDILPKVQYYAYLQVQSDEDFAAFMNGRERLYGTLKELPSEGTKLNVAHAYHAEHIYSVLRNLFTDKDKR